FLRCTPPATCAIYARALRDALPICAAGRVVVVGGAVAQEARVAALGRVEGRVDLDVARQAVDQGARRGHARGAAPGEEAGHVRPDRKSTRLNSSHVKISYAVFCLKK